MSNLPQQTTFQQYLASGSQSIFVYPFYIPRDADITVYATPPNQAPNPEADLLVLNVNYSVQGAGSPDFGGGTITLLAGNAVAGTIITLDRTIEAAIDTEFSQARNITGSNLDDAFDINMLVAQQNQTNFNLRALRYITNSFQVSGFSNQVPVLPNNYIWTGLNGSVIASQLEENPDWSTLRSQLASRQQGADGASMIGYYDQTNSLPTTVAAFLNNIVTFFRNIFYTTGDIKPTFNISPLSGWILWQNGSIGSAASGATLLASATAQALYLGIWNGYANAQCAVSGGRGANALADFNANKTITLPPIDGRTIVSATNVYAAGDSFGTATVALTSDQNGAHTHTINTSITFPPNGDSVIVMNGKSGGEGGLTPGTGGIDLDQNPTIVATAVSSGTGAPHNNLQPSVAIFYHIKL